MLRPRKAASSASVCGKPEPLIALAQATAVARRSARLELAGMAVNACMAPGFAGGRPRRPVEDMIETRLAVRAGWSMATSWAIMPPIEAPAT